MLEYPPILKEIGWNVEEKTFDEFLALAEKLKVRVFYHEGISEGMHFWRRGRPIIVLNKYLTGHWLTYVAWHELAHFLLGHQGLRYFVKGSLERAEQHANIVGICAVIPEKFLYEVAFNSEEIWNFPKELVKLRLKIFANHTI